MLNTPESQGMILHKLMCLDYSSTTVIENMQDTEVV